MKNRHRAREVALQFLYHHELSREAAAAKGEPAPDSQNFDAQAALSALNRHFQHFQVPEGLREFATELAAGTLRSQTSLDEKLERHAANWKVSRMSAIDRNLLRMAAFEMINFPDIPHSVTIDEAIELGKQFGTAETAGFINGVLDSLRKEMTA